MTVKELHDALSMAYWKGVEDYQRQLAVSHPPIESKEFNEELHKLSETYIDKLIVSIVGNLKLSVRIR